MIHSTSTLTITRQCGQIHFEGIIFAKPIFIYSKYLFQTIFILIYFIKTYILTKREKKYTGRISIVCWRPCVCLVILPFGDDAVYPLTYGFWWPIWHRQTCFLSIIIPNSDVFRIEFLNCWSMMVNLLLLVFLLLNEDIEKYARTSLVEMYFNGHAMFTPALGIVPKYLLDERVVMLTKIQTPIPHPVLNESYVL